MFGHEKKIKDTYDVDRVLVNSGLCYAQLKDFSNAKIFVDSALQICGAKCSNRVTMDAAYALGVIHLGLKQFDAAENQFLISFEKSKLAKDIRFQLDNIYLLSEISMIKNQDQKAAIYLAEAEDIISTDASYRLELIKIYFRLFSYIPNTKILKRWLFTNRSIYSSRIVLLMNK